MNFEIIENDGDLERIRYGFYQKDNLIKIDYVIKEERKTKRHKFVCPIIDCKYFKYNRLDNRQNFITKREATICVEMYGIDEVKRVFMEQIKLEDEE